MYSEVSATNLAPFVKKNRVGESLTIADLREMYEVGNGTVIVYNCCGPLKVIGDD